jgi:hypothetical protein
VAWPGTGGSESLLSARYFWSARPCRKSRPALISAGRYWAVKKLVFDGFIISAVNLLKKIAKILSNSCSVDYGIMIIYLLNYITWPFVYLLHYLIQIM